MEVIILHNKHRSCSEAVVHSNIPHSAANKGNFEQIRVMLTKIGSHSTYGSDIACVLRTDQYHPDALQGTLHHMAG